MALIKYRRREEIKERRWSIGWSGEQTGRFDTENAKCRIIKENGSELMLSTSLDHEGSLLWPDLRIRSLNSCIFETEAEIKS